MRRSADKYHLMRIFCAVAEQQSFAAAARTLEMPLSSVSKSVAQLELQLGIQLIYRTTRSMSLTDAGHVYFQRGRSFLREWRELDQDINELITSPRGELCITAPVAIGQCLVTQMLSEFMLMYPQITIDLQLTDKVLSLIDDDVDVAIRSWSTQPDDYSYKLDLWNMRPRLVASSEYLKRAGTPTSLEALQKHTAIVAQYGPGAYAFWQISGQDVIMKNQFRCNNYVSILEAAKQGVGIANLYTYLVSSPLQTGELIEIIPELIQSDTQWSAFYKRRREASAKLDAFLQFAKTYSARSL